MTYFWIFNTPDTTSNPVSIHKSVTEAKSHIKKGQLLFAVYGDNGNLNFDEIHWQDVKAKPSPWRFDWQ